MTDDEYRQVRTCDQALARVGGLMLTLRSVHHAGIEYRKRLMAAIFAGEQVAGASELDVEPVTVEPLPESC